VVLAHLQRRWSLSGREGLGSSLPPAELARRNSGVFEELKRLFSTTPEVGKEMEANGGHRGDRTLDRTRSLFDRTRPVCVQHLRMFLFLICSASGRCFVVRSLCLTNASDPLWDQRVQSILARPVHATSASGRCFAA
jgi:hypothetical protein